jgi:uncharacterized membrane protein YdjX (TVP38/TMEM64 family)
VRLSVLPAVLIAGAIAYYWLGLGEHLSFDALARNRERLLDLVAGNPVVSAAVYILVYAAVVALSLPGGALLTLAGGFLFGIMLGTAFTVVAATLGATLLFLIARSTFRELFRARAGGYLRKLEDGFRRDALSYLLFLRLVPLFPFWLVNLVPALLEVPLRIFVIGTFFGIIPGTLVIASVGNGLGAILDQGEKPDLGIIFAPTVLLPLLGLAVLALVPVVYKKFRPVPQPDGKVHG